MINTKDESNRFTPRPHQVDAVNAITKELMISDRTTAVMACGSGKTLVALWVAESLDAKNILILLPSLALVSQTFLEWSEHTKFKDYDCLFICSDKTIGQDEDEIKINPEELAFPVATDIKVIKQFLNQNSYRKIVFSTYHSCDLIPKEFKFDLAIFDEAHKTAGRQDKAFAYALQNKNINISKRLFLTATPKHYDINKKQSAFSMDDESIYGKVCYKLSFSAAVKQNIICPYKIIISTLTEEEVNRELINTSTVNIKKKLLDAKNIANSLALTNAISQNDIKKAFTFHKSIKEAKCFASNSSRIITASLKKYKILHINGEMNSIERKRIMEDFKRSSLAILSNARCLTEGIDVPSVDMVVFMSPKKSQIDVIQAAGRAMRKHEGKKEGYILIPIFLEAQENIEEALNKTQYNDAWNILQSLQEYDEDLFNTIAGLQRNAIRKKKVDFTPLNKKIEIIGDRSNLQLETLRKTIITKIVDKLTFNWDDHFEELLIFKEKYGHSNIPHTNTFNPTLGDWVRRQREAYRLKTISQPRINKLNSIGFVWDRFKTAWDKRFEELLIFKDKHGHVNVPRPRGFETPLGEWVSRQRENFKNNKLAQKRIDKLNSIGFDWNPFLNLWDKNFEKLLIFKKKYGHTFVQSRSIANSHLGQWLSKQRKLFKDNQLAQERIDKLNSIGFVWDIKRDFWQEVFEKLVAFKEKFGHLKIPKKSIFRPLAQWIIRQRMILKNNNLSQERIDKLNSIGFDWSPIESAWNEGFKELITFKEKYGHMILSRNPEFSFLKHWVFNQRKLFKENKMTQSNIDKLNSIGFIWKVRSGRKPTK